jgi:hypothetical protein
MHESTKQGGEQSADQDQDEQQQQQQHTEQQPQVQQQQQSLLDGKCQEPPAWVELVNILQAGWFYSETNIHYGHILVPARYLESLE